MEFSVAFTGHLVYYVWLYHDTVNYGKRYHGMGLPSATDVNTWFKYGNTTW